VAQSLLRMFLWGHHGTQIVLNIVASRTIPRDPDSPDQGIMGPSGVEA